MLPCAHPECGEPCRKQYPGRFRAIFGKKYVMPPRPALLMQQYEDLSKSVFLAYNMITVASGWTLIWLSSSAKALKHSFYHCMCIDVDSFSY